MRLRGFYVVETALTNAGGHPSLFRHLDASRWRRARAEIDSVREQCHSVLLSWEGIHVRSAEYLLRLRELLFGLDVSIIYYIREQAELIQSGLLQRLKKGEADGVDLNALAVDFGHLLTDTRRYDLVIDRLAMVFGAGAIDLRVFEPGRLVGGDAKADFLDAIGVSDQSGFSPCGNVNASLSVEAALAIQLLDPLAQSADDREHLRAAARAVSRAIVGGTKYFLSKSEVARIRAYFRDSNAAVADRFFRRRRLFDLQPAWRRRWIDRAEAKRIAAEIEAVWRGYRSVLGRHAAHALLAPADQQPTGWATIEGAAGVKHARLLGTTGSVRVLPSPFFRYPHNHTLEITVETAGAVSRRLSVGLAGRDVMAVTVPEQRIAIPLDQLHPYGAVDLTLGPIDGSAPLDLAMLEFQYR